MSRRGRGGALAARLRPRDRGLGSVSAVDLVDLSFVTREVARHAGDLERCYTRRLLASPDLTGMVVLRWTITPTGTVSEQAVQDDTLEDPEVLSCLQTMVSSSHFPALPDGPLEVIFPFSFGQGAPPPPGC